MEYMILIYDDEKLWAKMPEAESKKVYAAYGQYTNEMIAAGAFKAGAPLKPTSTATTVRMRNGKLSTTDGPFAETKEQLGGYYLVDVPNIEDALKWASKCPSAAYGSIEVRPVQASMVPPA